MLLGFSYLYRVAAHTVRHIGYNTYQTSQLGYLNRREIRAAAKVLLPHKMRIRYAATEIIKASAGLLVIAGICLIGWLIGFVTEKNRVHELAVAEENRIEHQVSRAVNRNATLVSVHAGLASVTSEYVVARVPDDLDLSAFERRLHKGSCAENGANIKKGLSYIYVYKTSDSKDIARFEVSSCP